MSTNRNISDNSAIIFLPTEVDNYRSILLHGEVEHFDNTTIIYFTGICPRYCRLCLGSYSTQHSDNETELKAADNWVDLRKTDIHFSLKEFKINGNSKDCSNFGIVVIYYDRRTFIEAENSLLSQRNSGVSTRDHFQCLIEKFRRPEKPKKSFVNYDKFLNGVRYIFTFMLFLSSKMLYITKYSSIASHVNNYLTGIVWMTKPKKQDKREHIKRLNCLLSVIVDIVLGGIILNNLTQHFPLESLTNSFSGETVVHTLKDLIHWLTGDPAGFKLNYRFSKSLATFFLFYIDIWCAFLAILKPVYKIILQTFLVIGKAGITFQVSIIEDVLIVLTFHIYCICLFAARLYNIQIYALISLWRLFLGRKKNPLRGRVDSCKYTPEQLFIGTLGFTILLFLLPTTLIYYVVFTFLRVILISCKMTLRRIRYLVQSLQLYSIILWITSSPKVSSGIKLIQYKSISNGNCLVFHAKPVCTSLREALVNDKPDFLDKPENLKFGEFFYSLLIGTVKAT